MKRWKSVSSWRENSRKMLQFNRSAPVFQIYCGSELFTYTGLQIFSQFAASKLFFFFLKKGEVSRNDDQQKNHINISWVEYWRVWLVKTAIHVQFLTLLESLLSSEGKERSIMFYSYRWNQDSPSNTVQRTGNITKAFLYILFCCLLILSQMLPTMFKPREIYKCSQRWASFGWLSLVLG